MNHIRRDVFQAISDPTRRAIIDLITKESMNLKTVADHFDISRPAISKHMKILSQCGLVEIIQFERDRFCMVRPEKLREVSAWLDQYRIYWEFIKPDGV